jgi:hypothetical protein
MNSINPTITNYQTAEMTIRILTPCLVLVVSSLNFISTNIISNESSKKYIILTAGLLGIFVAIPSTIIIEFFRNRIVKEKKVVERGLPFNERPLRSGAWFSNVNPAIEHNEHNAETWIKDLIPFRYKWD